MVTFDPDSAEDEILYGTAGYIYALLLIEKHLKDDSFQVSVQKLHVAITKASIELYKQGLDKTTNRLSYSFPRGRQNYIGAAHGSFGCIYIMLVAMKRVPLLKEQNEFQ